VAGKSALLAHACVYSFRCYLTSTLSDFLALSLSLSFSLSPASERRLIITKQRHLDARLIRRSHTHHTDIRRWISSLNSPKLLHNPRQHITRLNGNQHLRRTATRPATEGNKGPIRSQTVPSIGIEILGILAPDVRVAVLGRFCSLGLHRLCGRGSGICRLVPRHRAEWCR